MKKRRNQRNSEIEMRGNKGAFGIYIERNVLCFYERHEKMPTIRLP
jgi:hypothetical protein